MQRVLGVISQGAARIFSLLTIRTQNKTPSHQQQWKAHGNGINPDHANVFSPEGRSLLL